MACLNRIRIFFVLPLFLSSCTVVQKNRAIENRDRTIVYRVFDSLENRLINDIKGFDKDYLVFIGIEPCGNMSGYYFNDSGRYIYNIRIYYRYIPKRFAPPLDSIFSITNRKMLIGNKQYPIYINRVDDVFCLSEQNKNKKYKPLFDKYDVHSLGYYIVDMSRGMIVKSLINDDN